MTAAQAFPGATGVTLLDVYDWPTADGLRGGSAHIHLASTEGYVVLRGAGRLQTLGRHGYQETPLRPGDCLWFTPGTVHRLVNDDGQLQILVVMQNAGLPEAGDCVLTFPPDVLADPVRYEAAATLSPAPDGVAATDPARLPAIRWKRPRGAAGTWPSRGSWRCATRCWRTGQPPCEPFLDAAVALTAARVPDWRRRWRGQAAAVSELTGQQLDGIEARHAEHLRAASVLRVPRPAGPRSYGMCGRLTPYPAAPLAGD